MTGDRENEVQRERRAVVTGASAGIGAAVVRGLVAAGPAPLPVTDRMRLGRAPVGQGPRSRRSGGSILPLEACPVRRDVGAGAFGLRSCPDNGLGPFAQVCHALF